MTDIKEYGKALFLLAKEEDLTDTMREELLMLDAVIKEEPSYLKLIDIPAIPKEERLSLIGEALCGLNRHIVSFVKLLAERHLSHSLPLAIAVFLEEYDREYGIERVEAVSAVEMTQRQIDALRARIEAETKKTVIIKNTTDPSILGGIKLRYSGIQLDGSLRSRLDDIEKTLKNILI
jgi:ATP synthase F1 delta subunit